MAGLRRRALSLAVLVLAVFVCDSIHAVDKLREHRAHTGAEPGYRFERGGWTYVHLEGTPRLASSTATCSPQIADLEVVNCEPSLDTPRLGILPRSRTEDVLAAHRCRIPGRSSKASRRARARGIKLDVWASWR